MSIFDTDGAPHRQDVIARDVAAVFEEEGYRTRLETRAGFSEVFVTAPSGFRVSYAVGLRELELGREQARVHVEHEIRRGLQRNPDRGPSRPYVQKREHGHSALLAACMREAKTEEQVIDALADETLRLMREHMRRAELAPVPAIVLSETDAVRAAVAAERRRCLDIVTNVEPGDDVVEMRQRISDRIRRPYPSSPLS
jgi:hypothetical protein